MPLASTETAIASTVKSNTATSIPSENLVKPTPSPTPTTDDLCSAAAREVAGSRPLIAAQKEMIELLQQQATALQDKITAQNELLNEYRKVNQQSIDIQKKYDDIVANKDLQIANRDKEIEVLKNRKPNLLARLGDIALGAALFAIFR